MPKEEYDGRSLYEKLKETKDKKQEAFEEKLKFSKLITHLLNKYSISPLPLLITGLLTENYLRESIQGSRR